MIKFNENDAWRDRLHAETELVLDALRKAGNDAALNHKRLGLPLVSWRDGKVVLIPADEIVVDDDGAAK
jgi:hypothetical protein